MTLSRRVDPITTSPSRPPTQVTYTFADIRRCFYCCYLDYCRRLPSPSAVAFLPPLVISNLPRTLCGRLKSILEICSYRLKTLNYGHVDECLSRLSGTGWAAFSANVTLTPGCWKKWVNLQHIMARIRACRQLGRRLRPHFNSFQPEWTISATASNTTNQTRFNITLSPYTAHEPIYTL